LQQIEKIGALLTKYLLKELTSEETVYLNEWVNQSTENLRLFEEIKDLPEIMGDIPTSDEIREINVTEAWQKMIAMGWKHHKPVKVKKLNSAWYMVAAVLVGIICMCTISWKMSTDYRELPAINSLPQNIIPNTQRSSLTLNNGETIILDGYKDGVLATQGSTIVIKKGGWLRYAGRKNNTQQVIYNKVTVPWGGDVVNIQLSDGSKVWLNAGSTMTYPVAFPVGERKVEITGEGYFEVAIPKSSSEQGIPFIVSRGRILVAVQDARFNVNMSNLKSGFKVTLLKGSGKIKNIHSEQIVKSGQQAILDYKAIALVNIKDVDAELAWKKE
jgi:hypothetical protein